MNCTEESLLRTKERMEWKKWNMVLGVRIFGGNRVNGLAIAQPDWKVHLSGLFIRLHELLSSFLESVGNLKPVGCHPPQVNISGSLRGTSNAETLKHPGSFAGPAQTHPNHTTQKSPLNSQYRPPDAF